MKRLFSIFTALTIGLSAFADTTQMLQQIARKKANAGGGGSTTATASAEDTANLLARWVADKEVYSDAGITAATNTDTVQQWNDDKNSNNLTQSVSGSRPTYVTGVQNGLPGIQFDGSADFMEIGSQLLDFAAANNNTYSIYVVASLDTDAVTHAVWWEGDTSASNEWVSGQLRGAETNNPADLYVRNGGSGTFYAPTSAGYTATSTFIVSWIFTDDGSSYTIDTNFNEGTGTGTGSGWNFSSTPSNGFAIGVFNDSSPSGYLDGYIHEIRIYSTTHNGTTRDAVYAEMTADWGL